MLLKCVAIFFYFHTFSYMCLYSLKILVSGPGRNRLECFLRAGQRLSQAAAEAAAAEAERERQRLAARLAEAQPSPRWTPQQSRVGGGRRSVCTAVRHSRGDHL